MAVACVLHLIAFTQVLNTRNSDMLALTQKSQAFGIFGYTEFRRKNIENIKWF
jgi:hypothetical protein